MTPLTTAPDPDPPLGNHHRRRDDPTARAALTPGLDQTRTLGLVTLPGAFVGVLLGGGTALGAGAAQVLVLTGLLAAQTITSASTIRLIAAGRVVRRDLCDVFPR